MKRVSAKMGMRIGRLVRLRATAALLALGALVTLGLSGCALGGPRPCGELSVALIPGAALTLDDGVVYGNRGEVFALRASDGTLLWNTADTQSFQPTVPVVDGQTLIVSTGVGAAAAWRASDGTPLWRTRPLSGVTPLPTVPDSPPVVSAGVVYQAVGYGSLAAWDEHDGHLLWMSRFAPQREAGVAQAGGSGSLPLPVVMGDAVFLSTGPALYALRAGDGAVLWELPAPTGGFAYATPFAAGAALYVAATDGSVSRLDPRSCAMLWRVGDDRAARGVPVAPASIVVLGQAAYTSASDGTVRALDAASGRLLWGFATGDTSERLSSPTLADGRVFVTAAQGLYALDAGSGKVAWHMPLGPGPVYPAQAPVTPVLDQGMVFVMNDRGVQAWHAADGTAAWQYRSTQLMHPIAGDGLVLGSRWGVPAVCGRAATPPAVLALRRADGTTLWTTSA